MNPQPRLERGTYCLGGHFVDTCQLLLSWSEPVCSASGYSSVSPVSAPFWHAVGTDASRYGARFAVNIALTMGLTVPEAVCG